jgi:hypothetical protein
MRTRIICLCKVNLPVSLLLLLALILPGRAHAQWPPFSFKLKPSYSEGQITYQIDFRSQVDWRMADVTLKISLPEGTRFVKAEALPTTSVDFDGAEVTFFTFRQGISDAYFVVEVTDPAMTVFTTHAWISWGGDQPGDYLTEDVSIDITLQPLNWVSPKKPRLQLEAGAMVTDDQITYTVYYEKNTGKRMWDVIISVPVPEGTTFLEAQAPPPFVAGFNGQEVFFSVVEFGEESEVGSLSFTVSTQGVTAPSVATQAWATWKNVGRKVGRTVAPEEVTMTGDIVVQPGMAQWVVADVVGDIPLSNYDLASVVFQPEKSALKVIFYTSGDLGPVGEPLQFILYIDNDCRADTGKPENGRGVEYRVRYRHDKGEAVLAPWDGEQDDWSDAQSFEASSLVSGNMVAVWLPYESLEDSQRFCWAVEAKNKTKGFDRRLPTEKVPGGDDLRVSQYEAPAMTTTIDTQPSTVGLSNFTSNETPDGPDGIETQPSTVELSNSEVIIESDPVAITPLPEPEPEVTREHRTGGPSEWYR